MAEPAVPVDRTVRIERWRAMEAAPAAGFLPAALPTGTDFAALLRHCRRVAGLTQEALAERSGLSIRAISDLERGAKRSPRFDTTRMLADGLGLTGEARTYFAAVARRGSIPPGPRRTATTEEPACFPGSFAAPIPRPADPLLGREAILAEIVGLLGGEQIRLVTLTGPGGVGKTRLALAVAAEATPAVAERVILVELGPLDDAALVPAAVGAALGVHESAGQPLAAALRARLADRRTLLILDNCEHLVPAAAALAADLLAACPALRVLATSRARLRLREERVVSVPPLALPGVVAPAAPVELASFPAVRLFVERARAVWPHFVLTEANAPTIAEICRRLDGLPLAIELAAARLRLLSPDDLLRFLSDRLRVLTGGPTDAPRRQRTLRDLVAWSHDLLAPEEQVLFRRIAVFAGGADLHAIAAIATDGDPIAALEGLETLVGQSLLERESRTEEPSRFAMLETVRAFAREQLASSPEEAEIREAHAAYFLAWAERAQADAADRAWSEWFPRLESEYANLRAALGWGLGRGDAETAVRLGNALTRFWLVRGHLSEGRRWLERALDVAGEPREPIHALALAGAGALAQAQGDYDRAVACHEVSLTICRLLDDSRGAARALVGLGTIAANRGAAAEAAPLLEEGLALAEHVHDDTVVAVALTGLGHLACDQGDYPRATTLYAESLARVRASRDLHGVAAALNHLGIVARLQGDLAGAAVLQEQSLDLRREMGDRPGEAAALNNLANIAFARDDLATATDLHEQSLAIERELGNRYGVAASQNNLAHLALHQGEVARAAALFQDALGLFAQVGDRPRAADCVVGLALVAAARGDATQAARLIGAAETLGGWVVGEDPEYAESVTDVQSRLGPAAFAAAVAAGSTRSLDQILAEAVRLVGASVVATPARQPI